MQPTKVTTVQAKALLREENGGAKVSMFSQKEHLCVLRESFLCQPALLETLEAEGDYNWKQQVWRIYRGLLWEAFKLKPYCSESPLPTLRAIWESSPLPHFPLPAQRKPAPPSSDFSVKQLGGRDFYLQILELLYVNGHSFVILKVMLIKFNSWIGETFLTPTVPQFPRNERCVLLVRCF